ncbi:MAG TPA: YeeE/YedE family protein [Phycisphaerales bacterium]|nr:YeeE/YedE family protein [Phycisphaerales bacterium]
MYESGFFAPWAQLVTGALTGLVFGFLLQKARVTRPDVIVRQFLLKDFTVLKVMISAVVVGAVGIYAMLALGWIDGLQVKNAALLGNAVGGAIFGVGMAVLGLCPGTGLAAIGDGQRDAIPGVLGMLTGGYLYALAHPWLTEALVKPLDLGKATLATQTHLSPWWFIVGLAVLAGAGFFALERWESTRSPRSA